MHEYTPNPINHWRQSAHRTELDYVLDAIFGSTGVLIRLVRYLLDESRTGRRTLGGSAPEGMEVDLADTARDMDEGTSSSEGRQSMDSSSRPTTPDDHPTTKPLTLLDIINQSQSPGCKRERSMTHIGSISIASIVPLSTPLSCTKSPSDNSTAGGCLGMGVGKVAERAVVTRRKVGLGRLFSGMGMGKGMGLSEPVFRDEDGDGISDEESESEDEDLIVII